MKLLLHACCGPCSLEPVRILLERGCDITIAYANSNIHPASEYAHRLATLLAWANEEGLPVVEFDYNPAAWEACAGAIAANPGHDLGDDSDIDPNADSNANLGSVPTVSPNVSLGSSPSADSNANLGSVPSANREDRCRACYRLRLEEVARYAAEHNFDALSTTLTVSPYQYTQVIDEELALAAERYGIQALFEDFRPFYPQATTRSKELGMYRQNYCGCRFSAQEAAQERAERKAAREAERQAKLLATKDEREAAEQARLTKKKERQAYAAEQERKRRILKELRQQREHTTNE